MNKKLLAAMPAETQLGKTRQMQLLVYLSVLLNVSLLMTLVYVLFSLRKWGRKMNEKTKAFLSELKSVYERSQEGTKGLIDMYGQGDKDPLNLKISARKEVIGDVLDSLVKVGLLTEKEALEQAETFDVEIWKMVG